MIGGCLLLVGVLDASGVGTMAIVFGAGTMTLTLYSLHVVMRPSTSCPRRRRPRSRGMSSR